MSNYYLEMIEDIHGDLVEINYFHRFCAPQDVLNAGGWPGLDFPDYTVVCFGCKEVIHREEES